MKLNKHTSKVYEVYYDNVLVYVGATSGSVVKAFRNHISQSPNGINNLYMSCQDFDRLNKKKLLFVVIEDSFQHKKAIQHAAQLRVTYGLIPTQDRALRKIAVLNGEHMPTKTIKPLSLHEVIDIHYDIPSQLAYMSKLQLFASLMVILVLITAICIIL